MTSPGTPAVDPAGGTEPAEGSRGRLGAVGYWLRRWPGWVLALGALAGALGQVLNLGDRIFGDTKPAVAEQGSVTAVATGELNAGRHDYCRAQLTGEALATCLEQPDGVGNVFRVAIALQGYEGACCRLDWTVVEDETGKPPSPAFARQTAVEGIESDNELGDTATFDVYVPNPARAGNYFVRFTLADPDGVLGDGRSDVLRIR